VHPRSRHVHPLRPALEHDVNGPLCWCEPKTYRVCVECDHVAPCWNCGQGGLIEVPPAVADADDVHAYLIIHNDR
jgi:hypothetical protein